MLPEAAGNLKLRFSVWGETDGWSQSNCEQRSWQRKSLYMILVFVCIRGRNKLDVSTEVLRMEEAAQCQSSVVWTMADKRFSHITLGGEYAGCIMLYAARYATRLKMKLEVFKVSGWWGLNAVSFRFYKRKRLLIAFVRWIPHIKQWHT